MIAHSPRSILLVDDSEPVRRVLRCLLEDGGYVVTDAGDAEQALALLRQRRFGVVLTDLMLPMMSGLDLIEEVLQAWPRQAIALISGSSIDSAAAGRRALSGIEVLLKPVSQETLLGAMARLFTAASATV